MSKRSQRAVKEGREKAARDLRDAMQVIADQPGGAEMLAKLAIELVLPIEARLRKDEPDHPALKLIDERRAKGLM